MAFFKKRRKSKSSATHLDADADADADIFIIDQNREESNEWHFSFQASAKLFCSRTQTFDRREEEMSNRDIFKQDVTDADADAGADADADVNVDKDNNSDGMWPQNDRRLILLKASQITVAQLAQHS